MWPNDDYLIQPSNLPGGHVSEGQYLQEIGTMPNNNSFALEFNRNSNEEIAPMDVLSTLASIDQEQRNY